MGYSNFNRENHWASQGDFSLYHEQGTRPWHFRRNLTVLTRGLSENLRAEIRQKLLSVVEKEGPHSNNFSPSPKMGVMMQTVQRLLEKKNATGMEDTIVPRLTALYPSSEHD